MRRAAIILCALAALAIPATSSGVTVGGGDAPAVAAWADDAGSYMMQVGDRCAKWQEGQVTVGINPTNGNLVTIACQCSPGIGDVCLWVQISYWDGWAWGSEDNAPAFAPPVADDGGEQGTQCRWHDEMQMWVWCYEYLPGYWTPHYPYQRCA